MSVLDLAECAAESTATVGGKAYGLGKLIGAGFEVPRGFVLTTAAYRAFVAANPSLHGLASAFEGADTDDELRRRAEGVRGAIESCGVPAALAAEVLVHYAALGESRPVAVRSSATAEDTGDASFAGQQETYLGVVGADAVLASIVRCWASLFTPQAVAYRKSRATSGADLAMAVVVQEMVPAAAAGVMITIDPLTGDRSQISIESAVGLGAAVVNGEVTPDRFAVDKVMLELRASSIAEKALAYRMDAATGTVAREDLAGTERSEPSLADGEVLALAALGKRVEAAFGRAQDIEWAVVATPGESARRIVLLQARPETVWSNRAKPSAAPGGGSIIDRMIRNMTMPVAPSK